MVKAIIREYNGGYYGRMGEHIAYIEPEYFKNGKIKSTKFRIIEILETRIKGYNYGNAKKSWQIVKIIEE